MPEQREMRKRTLGQALSLAAEVGISRFAEYVSRAEELDIPLAELFKRDRENKFTNKIDTKTYRLIGGNGMGKTERSVETIYKEIQAQGLNPRVYKEGIYPVDPEKDVLIVHITCTEEDIYRFTGIMHNTETDVPVLDEDGVPQYDEDGNIQTRKTIQMKVPGAAEFQASKMFPFSVFIFDEPNRARPAAQAFLAGMYGGENVSGLKLSRGASLVIATQNSEDGMNAVRPADAAHRSKVITMMVRFSSEEYLEWAVKSGVHPAVQVFAQKNGDLLESFKDSDVREAAPFTGRGLTEMSNFLYRIEEQEERKRVAGLPLRTREELLDDISYYAEGAIGSHPDAETPLGEQFALLYVDEISSVIPAVKHVMSSQINIGVDTKFPIAFDIMNRSKKMAAFIPDEEKQRIQNYTALESAAAASRVDAFLMYLVREASEIMRSRDRFWLKVGILTENAKPLYEAAYNKLKSMDYQSFERFSEHAAKNGLTVRKTVEAHTDGNNELKIAASNIALGGPSRYKTLFQEEAVIKKEQPSRDINRIDALNNIEKRGIMARLRENILEKDDFLAKHCTRYLSSAVWNKIVGATATLDPATQGVLRQNIERVGQNWKDGEPYYDVLSKSLGIQTTQNQSIFTHLFDSASVIIQQMALRSAKKEKGENIYTVISENMKYVKQLNESTRDVSIESFNSLDEEPSLDSSAESLELK